MQLSTVLQAVVSQQLIPSDRHGQVPAFEIMRANGAIPEHDPGGETPQIEGVMQMGGDQGMSTMDLSLAALFKAGTSAAPTRLTTQRIRTASSAIWDKTPNRRLVSHVCRDGGRKGMCF